MRRGNIMVSNVIILVALIVFLISVIFIYNARAVVKSNTRAQNENSVVLGLKVVGSVLCILSLFIIYIASK
ncbi:MAG: hypothetical protein N2749_06855 [Clostridia bacterium]|nr:hypothetical protein [Clostridia bacterium]